MIRPSLIAAFLSLASCSFLQAAPQAKPQQQQPAKAFKPFTGKITANKVRVRLKPDLDSHIVRQIDKGDLLLIVGEEGDFFAVEPPKNAKAYVFRTYILDNVVEANRVNVRLEPNQEAPIIGHLEAGAKVQSQICQTNHKWLEIPVPQNTHFYISKEFVVSAGGPEFLVNMGKRKAQAEELLRLATAQVDAEIQKSYEDMSIVAATEQLQTILRSFGDFPEATVQAKEALTLLKDSYLNKKIAFLEARAELSPVAKQELIARHKEESKELSMDTTEQARPSFWSKRNAKMNSGAENQCWDAIEESLYLSWSSFHSGKKMDDFYAEQKANSTLLSGIVEPYTTTIKDKPGNYLLRDENNAPVAYLYSTHVDLSKYVGKDISVQISPRPNNHFAFPAYFVLSAQ